MTFRGRPRFLLASLTLIAASAALVAAAHQQGPPRVVLISLDGARPALVEQFIRSGALPSDTGLGRLRRRGVAADQHIPATPSVTAVSHLTLATGSIAAHTDVPGNSFHPVGATIGTTLSGFGAPIGGYQISPLGPSIAPTAEPLWVRLRQMGRGVVTATWPGGDGVDVRIANTLVQSAFPTRVVNYTVPFGAFGGVGAQGFALSAPDFTPAGLLLTNQFRDAGHRSFSVVMVTANVLETIYCAPTVLASNPCGAATVDRTLPFAMKAAALDTTDDGQVNYDTLAFFAENLGVFPGPFAKPSTGPAYAKAGGSSALFYYEGSGNKAGTAFYVTRLDPNLATVRFLRYSANFIPRNTPVLSSVDDVNNNVGFWRPQPDFRIPERIGVGFGPFPDTELEAAYLDQVRTFVDFQTRLALRAIQQNPGADLVMVYIEQPDGSGHQFTITDPRQATDPLDARTIGHFAGAYGAVGQDASKIARYEAYLKYGYQQADRAVEEIIQAVGVARNGDPLSNVMVVSDHGMAPFHSAVRLDRILTSAGIDTSLLGLRMTGPAANIYINLQGREPGGAVPPATFDTLLNSVAAVLQNASDPNPVFNPQGKPLFTHVWKRPADCGRPGFCTNDQIGQDSGDIVALMAEGYNFDGAQTPPVTRLNDAVPAATGVFSVPNFYGAHGHDSGLDSMSAILFAAGPDFKHKKLEVARSIDIAPTIMEILGVAPAPTVDGAVIPGILRKDKN